MTRDELQRFQACRWILLDFDGPVCSAFAGYPAPEVAEELRERARRVGVRWPASLAAERDPMEVLRKLYDVAPEFHAEAEAALTSAETRSVLTADPTPGAVGFLRACQDSGRPLAIVSNNSSEAVQVFLEKQSLGSYVKEVVGRSKESPNLMKPAPHALHIAMRELSAVPKNCALVGDSSTDIEAAHAAGVIAVGYANRQGKTEEFQRLRAEVVVEHMSELASAFR